MVVLVAAALSHEGLETWTYTIAPFCYARAFERILQRHLQSRPAGPKLLANGGGYAYGVMGPTHHALEGITASFAGPAGHGSPRARLRAGYRGDHLTRSGSFRPGLYSTGTGRIAGG